MIGYELCICVVHLLMDLLADVIDLLNIRLNIGGGESARRPLPEQGRVDDRLSRTSVPTRKFASKQDGKCAIWNRNRSRGLSIGGNGNRREQARQIRKRVADGRAGGGQRKLL